VTIDEVAPAKNGIESPGEMLGNFFNEARNKWDGIKKESKTLLEGTETYSKDLSQ
jgi:hypothetical protein